MEEKALLEDGNELDMTRDSELIKYDWDSPDDSETVTAQDDWDSVTPDEDNAANQSDESFRLKHLGREFDVTRDEVITLAQKGVDYDRIRSRADALAENLRLRDAGTAIGIRPTAEDQRRERETREFIDVYSGVRPEDIPQEVWSEVAAGKTLLSAYQGYENRRLRTELETERREAQNRQRSTGPRPTLGAALERDEMETDWYRD